MKNKILLLHGALGNKNQMKPFAELLADRFEVHSFDFSGHGSNAMNGTMMSMNNLAQDILHFISNHGHDPFHFFGYSMGGYAALTAAIRRPELFRTITTLGTKFNWTAETATAETKFLDPEKMELKVPQFAKTLSDLQAPADWKEVVKKTRDMMIQLGQEPTADPTILKSKGISIQILVGEHDQTAGVEASQEFASQCGADFIVIPSTPHPLDKVDPAIITEKIHSFIP